MGVRSLSTGGPWTMLPLTRRLLAPPGPWRISTITLPLHPDEMTFRSPSIGEPVSLAHLIPRSVDDLKRRRHALSRVAERTFGLLGRSPAHVAVFLTAFVKAPSWCCDA